MCSACIPAHGVRVPVRVAQQPAQPSYASSSEIYMQPYYTYYMYVQARVGLITGASQGSTNQCVVLRQKEAEKPVMVL